MQADLFLNVQILMIILFGLVTEGLSENAKKSAQKAFECILEIDKNLN